MNPSVGGIHRALFEALATLLAATSPSTAVIVLLVITAIVIVVMRWFVGQTPARRRDIIALIRAIRGK